MNYSQGHVATWAAIKEISIKTVFSAYLNRQVCYVKCLRCQFEFQLEEATVDMVNHTIESHREVGSKNRPLIDRVLDRKYFIQLPVCQ